MDDLATHVRNKHGVVFVIAGIELVPAHPEPIWCVRLIAPDGAEVGIPFSSFQNNFLPGDSL
jgi:hypothetical protein